MRKGIVFIAGIGGIALISGLFVALPRVVNGMKTPRGTSAVSSASVRAHSNASGTLSGMADTALSNHSAAPAPLSNSDKAVSVANSDTSRKKALPVVMELSQQGKKSKVERDARTSLVSGDDGSELVYGEDGVTVYRVKKMKK